MKQTKWVTVTLNPAIDLSAKANGFAVNQVNTVKEHQRDAAGKGINVGRVLSDLGASVTLTGFLGQENSELFEALFDQYGLVNKFVMVAGTNRTNIKIHDNSGDTTDINFNGFAVTQEDIDRLHKQLLKLANTHQGFIFSGSLPENIEPQMVVSWIKELKNLGKKVVLDSSKEMLRQGMAAKPWMIKPNESEVSELLGKPVVSISQGVAAAMELVNQGIENVLLSMGEKGLIWVNQQQVLISTPPTLTPVSTVGAGDSVVAAFCWASQFDQPSKQLAHATAMGALAVLQTGVGLSSPAELEAMLKQIEVKEYRV
ncbi:phosphofructokinase [Vibrio zhanjiangensis]|uniref:Phosphofructokinase n=1 Tax=Vibrio zhanjiangensis TaxID=1046128 RepID=A0ABQ6EYZ1_9VIBR|nr:1-phosphofructokinase [Vibrio zhanjiangensis]GLT17750.1 phosphofructokinase [Vibrio zhanjiangensis]